MLNLPEPLLQKLRAEMRSGEKPVWALQPAPNQLMKATFAIWLFFIPWTLFSLFWMAGASGFKMPTFQDGFSFFPLFGVPFVLIGFGGLLSPFWLRKKATNTVYAITNQRLLICVFAKTTTVQAFYPKDINQLTRKENADGSGDLIFNGKLTRDSDGDMSTLKQGFYAVPQVRQVEKLIEDFLKNNQQI